jgi:hypothetical protein
MNWYKQASENKKISYSAVLIDEASRSELLQKLKPYIPDGWKIIAHHMTINMGPLKDPKESGTEVALTADHWAKDDKAMAVMVSGYERKMPGTPHITVAINAEMGAKPKDSNNLSGWQPISNPIMLKGSVTEVPFN